MRTLLKITGILLLCIQGRSLKAQIDEIGRALMNVPYVAFEEQSITFNNGAQPSTSILITAHDEDYLKDLRNWLKTAYGVETKKSSGFYSAQRIVIPSWYSDTLSLYFKVARDGDAARLNLIIESRSVYFSNANHEEALRNVRAALEGQIRIFYIHQYDEVIEEQQKHYDRHVSDLEKLRKKKEDINRKMTQKRDNITRTEGNIRSAKSDLSEGEIKIKSLNSGLDLNKKEEEQARRESDANQKIINEKEVQYNALNASGSLNTREGERVIKDLEKLHSKQEKLQSRLSDATEKVTESQNDILKQEQAKAKLESKIDALQHDVDKDQSAIADLERDLRRNDDEISDEQKQVESARADLDKLKTAKAVFADPQAK